MAYEYENNWRPAYEGYSAYGWFAASAALIYITGEDVSYRPIILYISFFMAAAGLYRFYRALNIWITHEWLTRRRITLLNPDDLLKFVRKNANDFLIGKGFEWKQVHAQRAHQLLSFDLTKLKLPFWFLLITRFNQPKREMKGVPWIHGLNGDENTQTLSIDNLVGNTVIFGESGTGKTRLFEILISQAIHRGDTVIIIDPKGDKDLRNRAATECKRVGRDRDFLFFHPAFPSQCVRIDPLKNFSRVTGLASRITAIMSSEGETDAFIQFAWRALNTICQGLVDTGESPSLIKLLKYVEGGTAGLLKSALTTYFKKENVTHLETKLQKYEPVPGKKTGRGSNITDPKLVALIQLYKQEYQEKHSSRVVDSLINMAEHDREHMGKMLANLVPILSMLTSGPLGELLSPDYNNPLDARPIADTSKVVSMGQVLYVGTDSLSDATVGGAIASILLADLASVAGDRYNYSGTGKIMVFVDEAAEAVNAPFVQMLNKGRGADIYTIFAAQTIHDFVAKVGSEAMAKQILGNPSNVIGLRSKDLETQEFITKSLGETSIKTLMHTQNTTAIVNTDVSNFSGGYGERLIETETDLFVSTLVGKLPNLEAIINTGGSRAIKVRIPILIQDNNFDNAANELTQKQVVNI